MSFPTDNVCILTGNANPQLAKDIADRIGIPLCEAFVGHFNNGEIQVMIEESSNAAAFTYVWELIDRDADFPFPDYGGECMSVQDCWAAVERRDMQEAIRSLLRKMNVTIVEQEENFDKTRFHGHALLAPCFPGNAKLIPRRYENGNSPMFTPMTEEEQHAYFQRHAQKLPTEKAVCSCKYCRDGIDACGKTGIHILQLLFPIKESLIK